MIEISYLAGSLSVLLLWILFRGYRYRKTKQLQIGSELVQLLFLVNLLVIYRFVFHPFETENGRIQPLIFEAETAFPFRVNLIPLRNLLDYDSKRDLLLNLIGNFAMFIPTGILLPTIYPQQNCLKKVALTGFLLSLFIEILQLPFAVRASDVDDLLLNTAGCLTGYLIYSGFRRLWKSIRK